ncbi:unnamed protein product, partial [Rotaria sp. Silwood2]
MSNINDAINQLSTATSITVLVLSIVSFVPGAVGLILNV